MDIQHYKDIFEDYGGMMRTKDLEQEKIRYRNVQQLIEAGLVEKVRYGYYQWVRPDDFSEAGTVIRLFPDAILCMDTALRYYEYSDRTPGDWHLAVSKDPKGSIGHTFMVCIHTENQNQGDFCPFALLEISVLHEGPGKEAAAGQTGGRSSSEEIATFGESDYDQTDAKGFINLYGLPIKVKAMVDGK